VSTAVAPPAPGAEAAAGPSPAGWRALVPRGRFARSVALLAGSTAVGQAILVAASPLLTRYYTPGEFGVLAVHIAIVTLLTPLATGRYELAVPLPGDDVEAADVLALALACTAAFALLVGGVGWVAGGPITHALKVPALGRYVWVVPMALLGAGAYQVASAWAIRVREFGRIAGTRVTQSAWQAVVQVGGGLLAVGPLGLLLGDALGRTGGTLNLARLAWRRDRAALTRATPAGMRRMAARYRDFPVFSSGAALLNSAGLQLPPLLFAALYDPTVAGLMGLAQAVVGMPSRLVGQAIAQVFMGEAARLVREDPARLEALFLKLSRRLLLGGGVAIVLIGALAPPLFALFFGARWHQAGVYVRWLAPMFMAQIVVSPLSQATAVLERQRLQLVADALRTVAVTASVALPWALGWSATAAVASYSLFMLVTYVGFFEMYRRILRHARVAATREAAA
jgi:O-antigen/teichoic acid export membrane protein